MSRFNSWDYQSDPEYLKGENEYLREQYGKLLSDSSELQRLGGMSPDRRIAERKAFEEELEENRRLAAEARAAAAKAQQEHASKTAELDRIYRAWEEKYNKLVGEAKTAEDRKRGADALFFESMKETWLAAEKQRFWPTFVSAFVSGIVAGIISSLIYDSLKPSLFHILKVGVVSGG